MWGVHSQATSIPTLSAEDADAGQCSGLIESYIFICPFRNRTLIQASEEECYRASR